MIRASRGEPEFADDEPLDEAAAAAHLAQTCFTTGPTSRLGVELEHVVHDRLDSSRLVTGERLDQLIDGLSLGAGGCVTREPGGQLELSTLPHHGLANAVAAADQDLRTLYRATDEDGLTLVGEGTDPVQPPRRTLFRPRYDAMEAYFDDWLPQGRQMMCSTAAVQVTVEAGLHETDIAPTWQLLHEIGPTLVAMFANSPFLEGRATGWKSTRQAIWWSLDPARTRPVHGRFSSTSPQHEYVTFALDAPVMAIRSETERWERPRHLSFRQWLNTSSSTTDQRRPTHADLMYHLTTLFPQVRARGPLEVRYLDALPGRRWVVPVAVLYALLIDPKAQDAAREAVAPVADCWLDAARNGLAQPSLAAAASTLIELATFLARERSSQRAVRPPDRLVCRALRRSRTLPCRRPARRRTTSATAVRRQ